MLRNRWVESVFVIALAVVASATANGQEQRRQGPSGPPPYDVTAETTIKAVAGRMSTIPAGPDRTMMIMAVTVEGGTLNLILAPPDYVKKQTFAVKEGETVDVTGVPGFRANGAPAMMIRQIKAGAQTLTLRDAKGQPLWGEK
jgi:hypothetical protein